MVYGAHFSHDCHGRIHPSSARKHAEAFLKLLSPTPLPVVCANRYTLGFSDAEAYGWNVTPPTLTWSRFIENKNNEILRLNGIYERMLNNAGVTIIKVNDTTFVLGPRFLPSTPKPEASLPLLHVLTVAEANRARAPLSTRTPCLLTAPKMSPVRPSP